MIPLRGLATGIGSLPHQDAEAALDLIFKYCPEIPFWPQLPKRDRREGMVEQFSEKIPVKDEDLESFYEKIISQDTGYFAIAPQYSQGIYAFKQRLLKKPELLKNIEFIKGQISGPFTFAASIKDDAGGALLHNAVFMQAISKGLLMKARWQVEFFREFGKKIIIFIDEPYLGCFGSAYTPINREDVVKGLTELTEGIKSAGVLTGVHCCGNTDWSIFTDIKTLDIINFDAFGFLDRFLLYTQQLKDFIQREGIICWGIVPTQDFSAKETPQSLTHKIEGAINTLLNKGLDKQCLWDNLLLSPACGLGALEIVKAEKILTTLSQTSDFILRGLKPHPLG